MSFQGGCSASCLASEPIKAAKVRRVWKVISPFEVIHPYTNLPLQWSLVLPGIAIAALTDWLDGVAARKLNQHSVLGSYLDPIADKILIGSVTLGLAQAVRALQGCWLLVVTEYEHARSMAPHPCGCCPASVGVVLVGVWKAADSLHTTFYTAQPTVLLISESLQDILPMPLAAVIVGRDLGLVLGGFLMRARSLKWRWPGAAEFFRLGGGQEAAPAVAPLMVSKANTCFQLTLLGGCALQGFTQGAFPPPEALYGLGVLTAGTTVWSAAAYMRAFLGLSHQVTRVQQSAQAAKQPLNGQQKGGQRAAGGK